jgi:group I intron endonuclease
MNLYGVGGVYKITNSHNGKVYIGSSNNIGIRWNKHLSLLRNGKSKQKLMQKDFDRHGESLFSISILEKINVEKERFEREDFYIEKFKSYNEEFGYNTHQKSTSPVGRKVSEETRKKIGESQIGKKLSEDHKNNISEGLKGRVQSEKTKRIISEKNRRKHISLEDEVSIRSKILSGILAKEIAKEFKLNQITIGRIRKEMEKEGLLMSKKERNTRIKNDLKNGISIKEISKKYNITETSVRNKKKEME